MFKTILYILSKQVGNTIYVRILYCKLKIITEVQCARFFEDHLVMKLRDMLSRDPLKKLSKSEQIYFEGMIAHFWSSNIWTHLTCLQQKRSRNWQICNVCFFVKLWCSFSYTVLISGFVPLKMETVSWHELSLCELK